MSEEQRDLIGMREAIELLKTSRATFYRWLRTGRIKGMKAGRQWRFYRGDIEQFIRGEEPKIDLPADITPLVSTLGEALKRAGARAGDGAGDDPVQTAVARMISLAASSRASDIHLTQHINQGADRAVGILRLRIDGVLHEAAEIDIRLMPAIVAHWKRLAACDVHERARPQDGRIRIKTQDGSKQEAHILDLRVNFLPDHLGEAVTVRILDPSTVCLSLDRLPYSEHDRAAIDRALKQPFGIILCTGPTGSGKTTTLYACLNEVARPEVKVMTIEDPVEFVLPWATQIQVREKEGVSHALILRACLRSDPDVIMVGEIRNRDTLNVSMQAALTGHVVLSTLHTDDAVGALIRMRDMGADPFLIAEATKLVIAQRLIRRLCRHCAAPMATDPARLDSLAEGAIQGGLKWHDLPSGQFKRAVGCDKCAQTGYRGRTAAAETLEISAVLAKALREGAAEDTLRSLAIEGGMVTMAADGIRRAVLGETSIEEVARIARILR